MTSFPAFRKASAIAKPMPVAPPVINTVFPVSFMGASSSFLHGVSDGLSEKHALIVAQVQLRSKPRPVAVVEPRRQADGGRKEIHVGRNQARVDEVVGPLDVGIAKPRFLVSGRVGQLVDVRYVDEANRSLGAAAALASTDRQASQVTRDGRHQPVVEWIIQIRLVLQAT